MKYSNAIVRRPGRNFCEGLTTTGESPDTAKALEQHASYCAALAACGVEVSMMEADETHPDGTFVEDTFVIAQGVAVATRPGAKSRQGEVAAVASALKRFFANQELIQAPGTLDGGDVCQVDHHFLIGISARSNAAGAAQLAAIVARHGFSASLVDIRGYRSLLHLKSGIAYLGERRLVVAPGFPALPQLADCERIEVPPIEVYGANCVRVNDEVLIAEGHPRLEDALVKRNYRIRSLAMSEFAKMDGGLSCLSLRF